MVTLLRYLGNESQPIIITKEPTGQICHVKALYLRYLAYLLMG